MNNLKIGLQLTKDYNKFCNFKSILLNNVCKTLDLEIVFINSDCLLKQVIPELDILATYRLKESTFNYASKKLKWIHFGAAGIEHSLFPQIINSKVIITNASGIHALPVSEFAIGMILFMAKQFRGCEIFKKDFIWSQWELAKKIIQLKNKTVGIIGFGSLGKAIAKKAKLFDMNVIATKRLQKTIVKKQLADKLIPLDNLDYLLNSSDFVVIACPLTPLSKGMIGEKEIKQMKSTAFIINVSRGSIIVENELIQCLKDKIIAGAALDVFEKEPLDSNSELFKLDSIFLSPHISGNFPEYQHDVIIQFSENLKQFVNGNTLKNRVCKRRMY